MLSTDYTDKQIDLQNLCNLWIRNLRDNAPIVIRSHRNRLVALDPIDDQLANLLARSINYRPVLVHRGAAAAVHAIVVRCEPEFLRRRQRLAVETQVLNALSDRFRDVEIVSNTFGNVEVVSGNFLVDQIARRFAGNVSLKIFRGVLERVFELLTGYFKHDERNILRL